MASAVRVPFLSVEEYLHSSYEPDADYVDGFLEERNLGEFDHGDLQWAVLEAINSFSATLGIRARPEVRIQVSPTRFACQTCAFFLQAGRKRKSSWKHLCSASKCSHRETGLLTWLFAVRII